MFESGDKVVLVIGKSAHKRTISDVDVENNAVYLMEGGDAFYNDTGYVWGTEKSIKRIVHA